MKTLFKLSILASFVATGAYAGSTTFSLPDVAPVAAQVTDWSGAYAGVTASAVTGGIVTYIYDGISADFHDMTGSAYGVFGGYNFQRGNFVYGGEVAAQFGEIGTISGPEPHFTNLFDAKARAGYVVGPALVYGFVGASIGGWDNINSAGVGNPAGLNYGAGVDLKLNERLFLGVEYIARNMKGTLTDATVGVEPISNAVQIRAGINF